MFSLGCGHVLQSADLLKRKWLYFHLLFDMYLSVLVLVLVLVRVKYASKFDMVLPVHWI